MTTRLRANREFTYPDAASLPIVRAAGGLSKLSPEQAAAVTFVRVKVGGWCDDMPEESQALRISRGEVEVVTLDDAPKKVSAKKKGGD